MDSSMVLNDFAKNDDGIISGDILPLEVPVWLRNHCCFSECAAGKNLNWEDDPSDVYEPWTDISNASAACLSGVVRPQEYKAWVSALPGNTTEFAQIEKYCRDRLQDVKNTNDKCRTLAAFSAIPAFMGFLSAVSISRNAYLRRKVGNGRKRYKIDRISDMRQFQCFVRRFILKQRFYTKDFEKMGLDWVLYKIVRCGLIHRSSLVNARADAGRRIEVVITHDKIPLGSPGEIHKRLLAKTRGKVKIILSAEMLCNWVSEAMDEIFKKGCSRGFEHSIIINFRKETPVMFAIK